MSAEARLKELGLIPPTLPKPAANYLPYRLAGNLLYLSGQGPRDANGASLTGKLGAEIGMSAHPHIPDTLGARFIRRDVP